MQKAMFGKLYQKYHHVCEFNRKLVEEGRFVGYPGDDA